MYFLLTASVLSPVQVFDFCVWCKVGTSFLSFSHFDNISMKLATLSQDCRTAGLGGGQVRSALAPLPAQVEEEPVLRLARHRLL